MQMLSPNDVRINYSDFVRLHKDAEVARFDRIIDAATGFTHDNPGARIRFATDAHSVFVRLNYTGEHTRLDALNGVGVYQVDGALRGTYQSAMRPGESIFELAAAQDGRSHLYEVLLPYGDSVEFRGLQVNDEAKFFAVPARPTTCLLTYGDSITHGFQASDISHNYPYLVGEAMKWQVVNFGFGSHRATAENGKAIAGLKPSLITILIGVNDCLNDKPLEQFKADYTGLLDNTRADGNTIPLYVLTPLSVPGDGWNNAEAKLENYRAIIRAVVAARKDSCIHLVEGSQLIPFDIRFFRDGLHPNDEGFHHLAGQLVNLLKEQANTL